MHGVTCVTRLISYFAKCETGNQAAIGCDPRGDECLIVCKVWDGANVQPVISEDDRRSNAPTGQRSAAPSLGALEELREERIRELPITNPCALKDK